MAIHPRTILPVCVGEAGIELGLFLAGMDFRPACYVERETYAAANLARLMEAGALPSAPIWSDVRTICDAGFRDFMEGIDVDLLTGGYPCQPFSTAGQKRGTDDPRHLWPALIKAISLYRPKVCFFENVAAHLKRGYAEVRAGLESLDYRVTEGLFTAGELGAGHRRERLFILAMADSECGGCPSGSKRFSSPQTNLTSANGGAILRENEAVAIPGCKGLSVAQQQEAHSNGCGEQASGSIAQLCVPLFPFRPSEFEAWEQLTQIRPDLAPAIEPGVCWLVDGIPIRMGESRSHRLRLHGNAVIPLVAAYAWLFLWADLLFGPT